MDPQPDPLLRSNMPPLIELTSVVRVFAAAPGGPEVRVLEGVDLVVPPGETVAIVGPSGSGKSTLLNIIGALDRPTSGRVRVADCDLAAAGERELAALRNRELGFVFQLHHLLPQCTALENALIPTLAGAPDRHAESRARALLERVGLGSRVRHRPGQMSGGECQRVALVRALINRPRLLLADEPTGSLDRAAAEGLSDLLCELNRETGVTLVVATHSERLAARMQRKWLLREGRLVDWDSTQ